MAGVSSKISLSRPIIVKRDLATRSRARFVLIIVSGKAYDTILLNLNDVENESVIKSSN